MTINDVSDDLFSNFCVEIINQVTPLLVAGGIPRHSLLDYLALNYPAAASVSKILSLRLALASRRSKLCNFICRRAGDNARNSINAILSDRHPSVAQKRSLVVSLVTLAAAFLKVNSNCSLMDELINIDVRIRALRLAIDEFNDVVSFCDAGDEVRDSLGPATNGSEDDWHLLPIFVNPHRVRLFPLDF